MALAKCAPAQVDYYVCPSRYANEDAYEIEFVLSRFVVRLRHRAIGERLSRLVGRVIFQSPSYISPFFGNEIIRREPAILGQFSAAAAQQHYLRTTLETRMHFQPHWTRQDSYPELSTEQVREQLHICTLHIEELRGPYRVAMEELEKQWK